MAEETPAEPLVEEPVALASATPEPETPPDYVSVSDFQAAQEAQKEELKAQEDRIVTRLKQSTGDKVKAAVTSEVAGVLSAYDQAAEDFRPFLKEGADLTEIKRNAAIDKLLAQSTSPEPESEQETPPQVEAPELASSPPGRETEIAQILETTGVSGSEPELTEYAEQNKGKPWFQVGQGFEDLAKSIAARSAGTSAGVVPSQGQVATEDLAKEFRQEVDTYLYPKDSEGKLLGGARRNPSQLRLLQAKYRELGLTEEDLNISPQGKADLDWKQSLY
ncbi:hypothetical protein LCGC14_0765000 [marine sediment metagenome]|uniref:Uncharacterized protein n=1 Tax=marine sediment metagenome TaxID=412755 RepID=A0A0F9SK80_9ZZZZ